MIAAHASPVAYPVIKESKVDPMWSADEGDRRAAIIRRALGGAGTLSETNESGAATPY